MLSRLILFKHNWEYGLLFGKGVQAGLCGFSCALNVPVPWGLGWTHVSFPSLDTSVVLTCILHNEWVAARDIMSTMQGPNRQGHSRKTHYNGPNKIPSSSFCCMKTVRYDLLSYLKLQQIELLLLLSQMCFSWVLFEKSKSQPADKGSLQRYNWWNPNWMCHTLFTWISALISSFSKASTEYNVLCKFKALRLIYIYVTPRLM